MHKNSLTIVLALVAFSVFASAGCGGSESSEATESLSKAQFIKRADAVCKKAEGEQLKLMLVYAKKHPGSEEEDMIEPAAIPPLEKQLEGLKALGAPEKGSAEVKVWLEEFESVLNRAKKNPGILVDLRHNPFAKADSLAAQYGFELCQGAP